MKKTTSIIIWIFLFLVLLAWVATTYIFVPQPTILVQDPHYEITDTNAKGMKSYHYKLFDENHKVTFEYDAFRFMPEITYVSEDVLKIAILADENTRTVTYYSIKRKQLSHHYFNPQLATADLVVHMVDVNDKVALVIEGIFDDNTFYQVVNRDFTNLNAENEALLSARFLSDTQLEITYLKGEQKEQTTEVITLSSTHAS